MYIEIENLSKKINGACVLENISVRFEKGKVYGLKGPNGSGKTMLMRAICGLITPSAGHVSINGEILGKDLSFPESIGILIENPGFISNYSGFKNLEILASIQNKIGAEAIQDILTLVGLDSADKKKYRKYSLGMKQKLGIAAAVMENPDILLLDEPLNVLDWFNGADMELFNLLNGNEVSLQPTLSPQQNISVVLPYYMYDFQFSWNAWEDIGNCSFQLVYQFYPVKNGVRVLVIKVIYKYRFFGICDSYG